MRLTRKLHGGWIAHSERFKVAADGDTEAEAKASLAELERLIDSLREQRIQAEKE